MAEAGIDISAQRSKSIAACNPDALDLVVTVCNEASRQCPPAVGRARILRQGFDDPPRLAVGANSEEEAMTHYRRVRDEIRAFVATLPRLLDSKLFEGESSD